MMYDMKISVQVQAILKRGVVGGSAKVQVIHRLAMRLNGCLPKNTIYLQQYNTWNQTKDRIGCLEGDREAGLTY